MAKKYYSSGVKASDLDAPKPSKLDSMATLSAGPISAPVNDDGTKAQAMVYLDRSGNRDLWDVLGLDKHAEKRRRALGMPGRGSALDGAPACPTCSAAPGRPCTSERQRVLSKWHIARKRLAGRIDNTEGITE